MCPPGSIYIMPGALNEPNQDLSAKLCDIFVENVDRMFKIFHVPTLRDFMVRGQPYLGNSHSAQCNHALKAAIWFAATNTLSDEQCVTLCGQRRPEQLSHYRRIVDVALAQADLMNTTNLATLQAFVTYIVSET